MLLYTVQSMDVISILNKDSIYFAEFEKSDFFKDTVIKASVEEAYFFMLEEYNRRKRHDFSGCPVWWYTSQKELSENYKYTKTDEVVIKAEVPDKHVLLYDADAYEEGPFCSNFLGWRGHKMFETNTWENTNYGEVFDKLYDLYSKDKSSTRETWKNIFNISRSNPPKRIHAITPYIDLYWLKRKHVSQSQEEQIEMEM